MTGVRPAGRAVVTTVVRTTAAVVAGTVVLGLWLVLTAPPATAHESVESTSPTSGARLGEAPVTVVVTLTGPLAERSPVTLAVTDAQARPVTTGDPTVSADRRTVSVAMAPTAAEGAYLVRFAGATGDGHPVRTAFAFTVGDATPVTASGSAAGSRAADPRVAALDEVSTLLGHLGLALAGGLVLLRTGGAPVTPVVRAAVLSGCLLVAAGAAGAAAVHGPLVAGTGPDTALRPELLASTLAVPHGKILVLRAVAALVLAVATAPMLRAPGPGAQGTVPVPAPARENVALVAGLVVLVSFAATGHPATDDLTLLTLVAGILHTGSMAIWLGAVVVTVLTGAGRHDEPGTALRRLAVLSRLAAGAVGLVVVSGTYLAWRTLGDPAALLTTDYGRALGTKLAFVLALLAVAGWGRRELRRRDPGPAGPRVPVLLHVRRTVLLEVGLAVAVLGAAARLVSTAPPPVP